MPSIIAQIFFLHICLVNDFKTLHGEGIRIIYSEKVSVLTMVRDS